MPAPHVQIRRRPRSTDPRDSICDFGPSAPFGPVGLRRRREGGKSASKNFGSRILSPGKLLPSPPPARPPRSPQTDIADMTAKANPRTDGRIDADVARMDGQAARKQQQQCSAPRQPADRSRSQDPSRGAAITRPNSGRISQSNDANDCRVAYFPRMQCEDWVAM